MKKFTTMVVNKGGNNQTIAVWLDEETSKVLTDCEDKNVVSKYIITAYKDNLKERKETRRHQSLDKSLDNGFEVIDERVDVEQEVERRETHIILHNAIKQLEPQQQWLIEQIYFNERSQVEVASELGASKMAITNRLKKIFVKLKKITI